MFQCNFYADKNKDLPAEKAAANTDTSKLKTNKNPDEKFGSAITVAALASVALVFMSSRSFQKNTSKFLNRTKEFLEEKLENSTAKESGKWSNFYEFWIRRINSFIRKSDSINNITSLKDILFMKLMYKTKPTKQIHQAITNYFEKISQKTVFDSYQKTEKQFEKMYQKFDKLDEYILKNSGSETVEFNGEKLTKQELINRAKEARELGKMAVDAFINKKTIQERHKHINKVTSSLHSTFWDDSFKGFWSKDNKFRRREMWQTFIAAEQVKGYKTDLAMMVSYARNAVSYTEKDQIKNVSVYVNALDNIIPAGDKKGIELIKRIKWFSKNPEIFKNNKELFFNELEKLRNHKFPININSKLVKTLEEYKKANINAIDKQVNDNQAGIFQEMLSYYYKVAPFELETSGALFSLKNAVKSFDKSVELESVDFFDKVRDLRLGSAPTDILTILFSFVALSFGLGHTKDKDERTGVMLKSGIPIVGGIATAMYSAAKLVSGGKSLALGFLSGFVLNRLGIIANKLYKNKKAQSTQPQTA